ncbi:MULTISPECIES: hypothetical protein [Paraliobacillus]|uniref:hypothetical protein n=1 Tax=Paraliobacillus TaxID=200903 RepID=UPI001E2980F8|nr:MULTISPECIES: hypothetical protein [Paraliobacillus]
MKKIVIIIIVLIIGAFGFVAFNLAQDELEINLENSTKQEISGLHLTYENIESKVQVPSIAPGKKIKVTVNPMKDSGGGFGEESLKLEYKDNEGNSHTEYVIEYFEEGYSGEADVEIKSIDENGKLEIIIKYSSTVF